VAQKARELAQELMAIAADAEDVRGKAFETFKSVNVSELVQVHLMGDELTYYSTLTLIYRAIPAPEGSPSSFCSECIDPAREAMRIHHECMKIMDSNQFFHSVYIHW
jgi:hypothetical protein